MKILINSEMRCGSRWLHYLLAELYSMGVSPEVDRGRLLSGEHRLRSFLDNNRIAKTHHATTTEVFQYLKPLDYKVITVVRNPRDRIVSKAFHTKYHPRLKEEFKSDFEAVKNFVYSDYTKKANLRQFEQMSNGYSTRNHTKTNLPYIWTTYEWMLDNIVREVAAIDKFLGENTPLSRITTVCNAHSFKVRTGRKQGSEVRRDTWRRKGIIGDWINWFTLKMFKDTECDQSLYWEKVIMNKGKDND